MCVGTGVEDLCRHVNARSNLVGLDTIRRAVPALAAEGPGPYDTAAG